MSQDVDKKRSNSWLPLNGEYLESCYQAVLRNDDDDIEPALRDALKDIQGSGDVSHIDIRNRIKKLTFQAQVKVTPSNDSVSAAQSLIDACRRYGHYQAQIDPLGLMPAIQRKECQLSYHGLKGGQSVAMPNGETLTASQMLDHYKSIYCGHIGFEVMHIDDAEQRQWLLEQIESSDYTDVDRKTKMDIMSQLSHAEGMETYLKRTFVGQKRFGAEGAESLIVAMEALLQRGQSLGVKEVAIGMAHRGRLNVMVNVMGMTAQALTDRFTGDHDMGKTSGDVKYHLGLTSTRLINQEPVKMHLGFNPSHLEMIASVIMGACRARQDQSCHDINDILPIVIHGDAAVAGQGIVAETLNMSMTEGYHVGGMVRIVVNNQVGFTTDPCDDRSTRYCTDVIKMLSVPIFHVNADDPLAVRFVADLAMRYRQRYHQDVMIDLCCFRRMGHNEADEPSATQPLMMQAIAKHPGTRHHYAQSLIAQGICDASAIKAQQDDVSKAMQEGRALIQTVDHQGPDAPLNKKHIWMPYLQGTWDMSANTSFDYERFATLAKALFAIPKDMELQRQVGNMIKQNQEMIAGSRPIQWGFAELMAYATLQDEGFDVRLTGQDVWRGTFAHRHARWHDQKTGKTYCAMSQLPFDKQEHDSRRFDVYNSVLTEQAVLGFEYGYAISNPKTLTIWEAQFGDFANGAQVIIDQFISSGWQKWQRLCGLVMLLPHGYEGMGPEHSSARLERFMQLAAQGNIQVCMPTTAAQIFHLLRRQMHRNFRKPLIVMTPKSLLRHHMASSSIDDLTKGQFQLIIDDDIDPGQVKRVIISSGKIHYELAHRREQEKLEGIALIRLEQLYPFPYEHMRSILAKFTEASEVVWCQEEPKNQGAWFAIRHCFEASMAPHQSLHYAGRSFFASPAVGYPALHREQQIAVIEQGLGISDLLHEDNY